MTPLILTTPKQTIAPSMRKTIELDADERREMFFALLHLGLTLKAKGITPNLITLMLKIFRSGMLCGAEIEKENKKCI